MQTDVMRSYSTIAPTPNSIRNYGCDWLTRSASREPIKLKLSLLSDIDPKIRSVTNERALCGRSYPSLWSQQLDRDPSWTTRPDADDSNYGRPVVGIKRTNSNWSQSNDYDEISTPFKLPTYPACNARSRIQSDPTTAYNKPPTHFAKNEKMFKNGRAFSKNGSDHDECPSSKVNERFVRDQWGGSGSPQRSLYDIDDAFDEVFASIVRGALSSGDSFSPRQTLPTLAVEDEALHDRRLGNILRSCYDVRAGTNYDCDLCTHRSTSPRHGDSCVTQPLYAKRAISSSNVADWPQKQQRYCGKRRSRAKVEHGELPPRHQLEKAIANGIKSSGSKAYGSYEVDSSACSYQPYHEHCSSTVTESGNESDKVYQRRRAADVGRNFMKSSRRYLQKSEPFLAARSEKTDFDDQDRSELSSEKKFAAGEKESCAWGAPTKEDTSSCSRFVNDDPVGKLRTTKSESNLKMASKQDLLLSDKEIYQIEIMNSGLSTSRVYVCQCLANLYFDDGATSSCDSIPSKRNNFAWRRIATGVPVLVLELEQCGNSNRFGKDQRPHCRLLIRLTELGNGFKLWEDVVDAFSGYVADRTFHTTALSADTNRRAGLSFDSHSAALKFHQHLREFMEEADSITNSGVNSRRRPNKNIWTAFRRMNVSDQKPTNGGPYAGNKKTQDSGTSSQSRSPSWSAIAAQLPDSGPLKKTDISLPCCFKHVTSLKAGDALPSAAMATSTCPSACGTLTRVNRSASIRSKLQQSPAVEDDGEFAGDIRPKRAQSCTQILTDHSKKRDVNDGTYFSDNSPPSNGVHSSNGSSFLRYAHSVEPV